jgi:DNA transposition AAA+ family ATPase
MKADLKTPKEEILKKITNLSNEEAIEVVDFIEFIHRRRRKEGDLLQVLNQAPGPRIGLQALRDRLSKIRGSMSEAVSQLRDERG